MKRACFLLALFLSTGLVFGLELSTGLGGSLIFADTTVKTDSDSNDFLSMFYEMRLFFDVQYVELNLGYRFAYLSGVPSGFPPPNAYLNVKAQYVTLSLLGKYPFKLAENFYLFPLVGFECAFNTVFRAEDDSDLRALMSDEDKLNLHQYWLLFGLGSDLHIRYGIFIRPEFLIGYRFLNGPERDSPTTIVPMRYGFNVLVGYKF